MLKFSECFIESFIFLIAFMFQDTPIFKSLGRVKKQHLNPKLFTSGPR